MRMLIGMAKAQENREAVTAFQEELKRLRADRKSL